MNFKFYTQSSRVEAYPVMSVDFMSVSLLPYCCGILVVFIIVKKKIKIIS
jgi:hypothetical protein